LRLRCGKACDEVVAVFCGCEYGVSIIGEADIMNFSDTAIGECVFEIGSDLGAVCGIPDGGGSVVAGGGEECGVAIESGRIDGGGVLSGSDEFPCLVGLVAVPELNDSFLTPGNQFSAIRREDRSDGRLFVFEYLRIVVGEFAGVVDADFEDGGECERRAVRAEGDGADDLAIGVSAGFLGGEFRECDAEESSVAVSDEELGVGGGIP
jgi:hypothetical protein